jgi:hypothetical protein
MFRVRATVPGFLDPEDDSNRSSETSKNARQIIRYHFSNVLNLQQNSVRISNLASFRSRVVESYIITEKCVMDSLCYSEGNSLSLSREFPNLA